MQKGRIVKSFTLKEMNCTDDDLTPEITIFAQMVQEFRDWYNTPIKVNSWKRNIAENKKCGGSKNSAHLDGRALDARLIITDTGISKWQDICLKFGKIGGINRYKTWTHFTDYEDKFGNKSFVIRDYRKE